MSEPIMGAFGIKASVATMAAAAAADATVQVIQQSEQMILGVPQSVLLAGIVGALIGVFILPNREAEHIAPSVDGPLWRRVIGLLLKSGSLGAFILGFAMVSSWSVALAGRSLTWEVATMIPAAGLLGVFIRPLLPKYLSWLEGIGTRLFGRVG